MCQRFPCCNQLKPVWNKAIRSYQTRPQSSPCSTPGGSEDEGRSFSCSLPSFAIQHVAWTLHCAQIYRAMRWNSPHSWGGWHVLWDGEKYCTYWALQLLPADRVVTFIARCWATLLWLVTMSYLMPLLNYFYATALTKANIFLNIIPVCIFHSCLVSRENIPSLRSTLLWQGNDAEHCSCYKAITLPSFPSFLQKAAHSVGWTSQLHTTLPDTSHKHFTDLTANAF